MAQLKVDIENILKYDYFVSPDKATKNQVYNALSKAVMSQIADKWNNHSNQLDCERNVSYMSAEFLVGRAVHNNICNLELFSEVESILAQYNLELSSFEDIPDPALGNGGLGRLAACYLESAASESINLNGYGVYYKYGLFEQSFKDGFQMEVCDNWTKAGDPWSVRRENDKVLVNIGGNMVYAVPYDIPVVGYKGKINTMRLWQSEQAEDCDFKILDNMKYEDYFAKKGKAEILSYLLYPNDSTEKGRKLRLMQQYFFCSASMQDLVRKHLRVYGTLDNFSKMHAVQLNDTHPVLAIAELIRIFMVNGLSKEAAYVIAANTFNFTNHTIMAEALEKWGESDVKKILPDIYRIIVWIAARQSKEIDANSDMSIIQNGKIHMANLAIYVSGKVNGVAQLHTEILKNDVFKNWHIAQPQKIINVTNGITPRRWLWLCNAELSEFISSQIGNSWLKNLSKLSTLKAHATDKNFIEEFCKIKNKKKQQLSDYIFLREGLRLPSDFCFDIQTKRLHEYKRQLLNALAILNIYHKIKDGKLPDFKPTAFIFGAKAAPAYINAKAIIKFINEIAKLINNDSDVNNKIKVVFVQNYNVSYAEKLMPAADISEQISMAGMEASGTGNMKFMLNGAVTLGTLDGANVEIVAEAGAENNYIFGLTVDEVNKLKTHYNPREYYENNPDLKRAVDTLIDGTFSDNGTGLLKRLYDSLLNHDEYLVFADFADYMDKKLIANSHYGTNEFYSKCLVNAFSAGKFTSDRSMREYAQKIWNV